MRRQHLARWSVALVLALLLPLSAVAAHGVRDTSTTITMYAGGYSPTAWTTVSAQHPRAVTALRVLADKFKQQTGITVKFVNPAGVSSYETYVAWMQANVSAGTAPDVVSVGQGPDFSTHGWYAYLDSYYAQPNQFVPGNKHWSDLYPAKFYKNSQIVGVGNHHYIIPIAGNYPYVVIGIFYNKALWAKAGITEVPKTWEQWMAQLNTLTKAGIPAMAPNPGENKSGSVWPLWSTLWPPFMAYLGPKVDTNHDKQVTPLEVANAVINGVIRMDDPHMQAMWQQFKRMMSYNVKGWNATDVEALWTKGTLGERYGGFWELSSERSNTQRKFDFGFFPPVVLTKATSPLVTPPPKYAPTGPERLANASYNAGFGIVSNSIKAHNNLDAAIKWLQFITTPDADDFIVNENADAVPLVNGTTPDPVWNQLNTLPVPDYGTVAGGTYPFALYPEQQTHLQHETVLWVFGDESDRAFYQHTQDELLDFAKRYIAESAKVTKK